MIIRAGRHQSSSACLPACHGDTRPPARPTDLEGNLLLPPPLIVLSKHVHVPIGRNPHRPPEVGGTPIGGEDGLFVLSPKPGEFIDGVVLIIVLIIIVDVDHFVR